MALQSHKNTRVYDLHPYERTGLVAGTLELELAIGPDGFIHL